MAKQLARTEVITRAESLGEVVTFDINPQQVAFRFSTPDDYTDFRDWLTTAGLSYTFSGRHLTANVYTFGVVDNSIMKTPAAAKAVGTVDMEQAKPSVTTKNPNSIV